jgi:hypothetical protein
MTVVQLDRARHSQAGYFSLADVPQQPDVSQIAISTGWWELDQIWRPYPGQFNVVSGIAGHGKSTFLLNVMCNLAKKHGTKSFLYVPENEAHVRDKLRTIWGAADGFEEFCTRADASCNPRSRSTTTTSRKRSHGCSIKRSPRSSRTRWTSC